MAENAIELAFKILNEGGDYILSNIRIPE